jgi:hypothetical protein
MWNFLGSPCCEGFMTKLLDEAIKRIRELPEVDLDRAAGLLLALLARRSEPVRLDEETREAVREGRAQAKRDEFASDEEMAALFKRHSA